MIAPANFAFKGQGVVLHPEAEIRRAYKLGKKKKMIASLFDTEEQQRICNVGLRRKEPRGESTLRFVKDG